MAQAPTGIGKTIGTVFPLLKAIPRQKLDKLFFLAAKTPGRQLALDALALINNSAPAMRLRTLELVARDKACEHLDKACHGESCPLAKGFYDRLSAARSAALAAPASSSPLNKESLRTAALAHGVCPYYLSQDLVRWTDVIVGDYNYYFDTSALLYALTVGNQWRVSVLVDEAHNLVDRARKMYTAELDQTDLAAVRLSANPTLKKPLDRLHRAWRDLQRDSPGSPDRAYQVRPDLPDKLILALQNAINAITEDMGMGMGMGMDGQPALVDVLLQRFYFDALHFSRMAESFGAGQLSVQVARHISTRYPHRERSLAPISALMARQYAAKPGNYLVFLSSYDYLEQLALRFGHDHPHIPIWTQTRRMDEVARAEFLARFTVKGNGIGFAVLGGAFAEGIDLPGNRLIGAFIATLGSPQINPVNEQIKQRMGERFGQQLAYDYTYLFPGVQKVVQAAGRVIRTTSDQGVIYLMDDRFARAQVQQLLPRWWQVEVLRTLPLLQDAPIGLKQFS